MLSRASIVLLGACALQLASAASSCGKAENSTNHFDDLLFGSADEGALDPGRVIVASILCWLITSVAVAAGIGGGGLLVPLYFIALDIPQTRAVSLSKGTIFGVAVGNFFFISREKHPKANRPLIDYPTAIFMQGGELMGVVLGVLLNLLLPQLVTIILSAVVLGFNAYKTLQKAITKRKAETKAFEKAAAAKSTSSTEMASASAPPSPPPSPPDVGEVQVEVKGDKAAADAILAEMARPFPGWAWGLLLAMVSFFIIYALATAKVFDPNFDNCHDGYWPVYILPFIFYGAITAYMAKRNVSFFRDAEAAGIKPIEGDIKWSPKAARMLVPAAVGAGVAAGLLGIGGGMILGPIFVALNFQPQVGTATTGFMILFTALGGTVKYLTVGKLAWRQFLWFGCIGAIGGQTGQRVVKRIIQKTGRPSYVVFILGGIIALAVVIMTTFGIVRAVDDANCGVDIWAADTDQFVCKLKDEA